MTSDNFKHLKAFLEPKLPYSVDNFNICTKGCCLSKEPRLFCFFSYNIRNKTYTDISALNLKIGLYSATWRALDFRQILI